MNKIEVYVEPFIGLLDVAIQRLESVYNIKHDSEIEGEE